MRSASRLRVTLYIVTGILLIALVGVYSYIYYRTGTHVERAIAAYQALSTEEKNQVERKGLTVISEATADSRERLTELFVPAENAVDFIQEIEAVGPSSGTTVVISSIAADPIDKDTTGNVGKITARIVVTGSWAGVMRALELLETLAYRSTIDQVSLDTSVITGEKATSIRSWKLSLDVSASTLTPLR